MANVTVRLQVLDGVWETCGVDRVPGVVPESLTAVADGNGPSACSFQLKRPVDNNYPDLFAFTPCEIEIGGVVVWTGRVKETPTDASSQTIAMSGEGDQFQMDDDQYELPYVESDLTKWVDQRSLPNAQLGQWPASGSVTTGSTTNGGRGQIVITWPAASGTAPASKIGGATLDLGPNGAASTVVIVYNVNGDGNGLAEIRGHDTNDALASDSELGASVQTSVANLPSGQIAVSATFSRPRRYVTVDYARSAAFSFGADVSLTFTAIAVASSGSWLNREVPVLRASDVFMDAVANAPGLATPSLASAAWTDEVLATPYPINAFWRFTETGQPFRDIGPNQSNGASNNDLNIGGTGANITANSTPLLTDGSQSGSVYFKSAGGVVLQTGLSAKMPDRRDWTVEMVFRPDTGFDTKAGGNLIYLGNGGTGSIAICFTGSGSSGTTFTAGGLLTIDYSGFGGAFAGNALGIPAFVAGQTYHLIVSRDMANGNRYTFYVNGVKYGPWDSGHDSGAFDANRINIGNGPAIGTARNFIGWIDEAIVSAGPVLNSTIATAKYQAAILQQTGDVERTSFLIPELAGLGLQRPRQLADAVNAYHRWRWRVLPSGPQFQPQPSTPLYEIKDSSSFADASANSGADMYNKVLVEAADAYGTPLRVISPKGYPYPPAPNIANPSAAVDVSNWTVVAGTLARDTTTFDTSPGSFAATANGSGSFEAKSSTIPMSFLAGRKYQVTVRVNPTSNLGIASTGTLSIKSASSGQVIAQTPLKMATNRQYKYGVVPFVPPVGQWTTVTLQWTQPAGASVNDAYIDISYGSGTASAKLTNFDSIAVYGLNGSTLLDRRGLTKTTTLTAQTAQTVASCQQMADIYRATHSTTPFKGSIKVTGQGPIRDLSDGSQAHPSELLLKTTELVRFSDRVDPDTGGQGRDGSMAQVTYTHATEEAAVDIDNTRDSLQALLARMAIVTG